MSEPKIASFRDVIDLWRSPGALALDIKAPPATARKWEQRNSIPAEWWKPILESSVAKANGVTAEILADLAAREPSEPRAEAAE